MIDHRLATTSCSPAFSSRLSVAGIFLNRKNVILLLMCIELMLLAVNFNFIAFSRSWTTRSARCSCSSF